MTTKLEGQKSLDLRNQIGKTEFKGKRKLGRN